MYKIDPKLTKMKDELIEGAQEQMTAGNFDRDELPIVLGLLLGISYCHEFFRMAEVVSDQLERINERLRLVRLKKRSRSL